MTDSSLRFQNQELFKKVLGAMIAGLDAILGVSTAFPEVVSVRLLQLEVLLRFYNVHCGLGENRLDNFIQLN